MTEEQLADKWIKELQKAGFSYNQMAQVFKLARIKHEELQVKEFEEECNTSIVTK